MGIVFIYWLPPGAPVLISPLLLGASTSGVGWISAGRRSAGAALLVVRAFALWFLLGLTVALIFACWRPRPCSPAQARLQVSIFVLMVTLDVVVLFGVPLVSAALLFVGLRGKRRSAAGA